MRIFKAYCGNKEHIEVTAAGDGTAHINVYSVGKTELGRRLTNFAKIDFVHPEYGWFQSMEGYWYWVATGKQFELYRGKWGVTAKRAGQGKPRIHSDTFEQDILEGLHCKLAQHPDLYAQLMACKLPLVHYYYFGGTIANTKSFDFILDELALLRAGKPLLYPLE